MTKKHFMCTHPWATPEARQTLLTMPQGMTDRQFFKALKTDTAETLQHWMSTEYFFYCHWFAESEGAIFDVLEARGFNGLMVSMPNEMQRYVSAKNITDGQMVNPFEPYSRLANIISRDLDVKISVLGN